MQAEDEIKNVWGNIPKC